MDREKGKENPRLRSEPPLKKKKKKKRRAGNEFTCTDLLVVERHLYEAQKKGEAVRPV